MNIQLRNSCFRFLIIVCISFLFLLIFSFFTSPLTHILGADAAFFQLVGKGMNNGLLPYRDFFDTKGFYLFGIEYLAYALFQNGRTGIFLIQVSSLIVSLFWIDKIHRLALGNKHFFLEFVFLLPYLWIAAATFEGGNLTEEFSLPFLLPCSFLCLKFFRSSQEEHPPVYALIYGISFGILVFIRVTNSATICAIIFCISLNLLISKRIKNFICNATCFLLGAFLSIMPAILIGSNLGILSDMLYQMFAFGYIYAAEGGLLSFASNKIIYYAILLMPLIICFIMKPSPKYRLLICVHFLAVLLAVSLGNTYPHYYTLTIPYIALGMYLIAKQIGTGDFNYKNVQKSVISVMLCFMLLTPKVGFNFGLFLVSSFSDRYVDVAAKEIASQIPEESRNKVFTWGINSKFYLETGLYPYIKYCDWQEHYIALSPEIQTELLYIFEHDAPSYVITAKNDNISPFFRRILSTQYSELTCNNAYRLHSLNSQIDVDQK